MKRFVRRNIPICFGCGSTNPTDWSAWARLLFPGAVEAVIHDYVAPLLLGQSAFDRERHWQTFFAYANFFGHAGAEMRAISALDIALWDLLGQHLGQPIYNLIGGRCRESIPIYNTCVNTPKYADQDGRSSSGQASSLGRCWSKASAR